MRFPLPWSPFPGTWSLKSPHFSLSPLPFPLAGSSEASLLILIVLRSASTPQTRPHHSHPSATLHLPSLFAVDGAHWAGIIQTPRVLMLLSLGARMGRHIRRQRAAQRCAPSLTSPHSRIGSCHLARGLPHACSARLLLVLSTAATDTPPERKRAREGLRSRLWDLTCTLGPCPSCFRPSTSMQISSCRAADPTTALQERETRLRPGRLAGSGLRVRTPLLRTPAGKDETVLWRGGCGLSMTSPSGSLGMMMVCGGAAGKRG